MSESTMKLLGLLRDDATIETIKKEMNLTSSQLAYRLSLLEYMGYSIKKKYYGNGDTTVCLNSDFNYIFYDRSEAIYTKTSEDKIRFLVISDLHFFHKDENRAALEAAYNYCIKKGIHIILNCGDLIDCMLDNEVPVEMQARLFIEQYPLDDHIINFCALGNHDIMTIKRCGIDFKKFIESKRLDIVPISYAHSGINIKNDRLYLNHPISGIPAGTKNENEQKLTFIGHSHTSKVSGRSIYVPSLSNVRVYNPKEFAFIPQALDVTINFNFKTKSFYSAVISQVIMEQMPCIIGEHYVDLYNPNPFKNNFEVDEYPSLRRVK